MAGSNTLEFTDTNWQSDVLDSDQPVLVDFWAPWCGPCKAIAPTIDELADDFAGKARVGKLNTDENQVSAMAQQVQSIPTIVLFKNGEVVQRFVGVQPKEKIEAALNEHV